MSRSFAGVESVYSIRSTGSSESVAQSLQALLPARKRLLARRHFSILDTVDGRVRRTGGRLGCANEAGRSSIWWRPRGGHEMAADLASPVAFAWNLPNGPLRRALTPVISVRRLFPQAEADVHGSVLDVIDERDKTVARVRIERARVRAPKTRAWRELPTLVTVTGLRGFEDAYSRILPIVMSRPGAADCPDGFHGAVLRALEAPTWESLVGVNVELDPAVRADVGVRRIHRAFLHAVLANESGVKNRLDTEFLHDFRVAIRRTRSLLGQVKHVLPEGETEHFRAEFSWLSCLTGAARDLDVLMLALQGDGLDVASSATGPLLSLIEGRQTRAHNDLDDALNSERYRRLIHDWRALIEQSADLATQTPDGTRALIDVVSKRAWRLSRRIAKSAGDVTDTTPAERLHAIRIDAKKLRYLIDSTPSFFDPDDLNRIVGALKKVQSALGDFNDAQVQESRLRDFKACLVEANGPATSISLVGQLAEERNGQQRDLRPLVASRLAAFAAKPVRSACRRAFKRGSDS